MKTFSVFSKRIFRYLFLSVITLYIIISTFYVLNTVYQIQENRELRICCLSEKETKLLNAEYCSYVNYFSQTIYTLKNNQQFVNAIYEENIPVIEDIISKINSSILLSHNAQVSIQTSENVLFQTNGFSTHYSEYLFNENTAFLDIANYFVLTDSGVEFLLVSNLAKNEDYSICIAISDKEVFKGLTPTGNTLYALIDKSVVNPQSNLSASSESYITKVVGKNVQFDSTLSLIDIKKNNQNITIDKNRYCVVKLANLVTENREVKAAVFYSIDTNQIHKDYTSQINRLVFVVVLILVFIITFLFIFKNRIIDAALYLKKGLEEKLRERSKEIIGKSAQLNKIFNSTVNGIRIIDSDFNVIQVNDSFYRMSGVQVGRALNEKCYNVFPSVRCHTDGCPLEQIKSGVAVVSNREVRFSRHGQKVVCDYKAEPFEGKNGEFIGIIEDFKDITELTVAEEERSENKKQFEALLNSMPVGVIIRDFDGNVFYQNAHLDEVFGLFNYEKKNLKYIFPASQENRFLEEDKFINKHDFVIVEEQLVDKQKTERTYVTHKFKFLGARNQPLIGEVSIDITKRKLAEHNAYVLTKAINNVPIGVIITSPEGIVESCNPEIEKISNQTADLILGSQFPGFMGKVNFPILSNAIKKALLGSVIQGEKYFSIYNGPNHWYEFSVSPVYNRRGEVAHLIFVFTNITNRKENEKEMLIAKAKAEESDRLKTAFLSNLSHEIRTPLNVILGFSSLLNSSSISFEEKFEIPNQLLKHSNALLGIINDLIDISAIETNQLTIKKRECKLNQILQNTYKDFVEQNDVAKLKTAIKLGVADENFTILTDPERLSQVVKHLLSNALKFTSKGFIEFGYTFKDPCTLLFYVIDTGFGLDKKEQEIIFKSFRQADGTATRNFSGLGLGLTISKNIIERLGGKIWVNSTKNQGSTFFFTLPYIPVRAKFDEFIPPNQMEEYDWSNKTIMVADDIDSNFKYIQTLVKPTGVNIIWARNGKEAVKLVKARAIDVVLMDIVMPEVDGFEATKQIKKIKSGIKVICQTAYPSPEHQRAGIESGMDKFLNKPIPVNVMLEAIAEYLQN